MYYIDSNNNGEFDKEDNYGQLFKPFTLAGTTFEATEIDPLGKYIVLKKRSEGLSP